MASRICRPLFLPGYIVEKRERGREEWVKAIPTPVKDTTANVQNLTEGQFYEFRVVAFNTAGMHSGLRG